MNAFFSFLFRMQTKNKQILISLIISSLVQWSKYPVLLRFDGNQPSHCLYQVSHISTVLLVPHVAETNLELSFVTMQAAGWMCALNYLPRGINPRRSFVPNDTFSLNSHCSVVRATAEHMLLINHAQVKSLWIESFPRSKRKSKQLDHVYSQAWVGLLRRSWPWWTGQAHSGRGRGEVWE